MNKRYQITVTIDDIKEIWWLYFLAHKEHWAYGLNMAKLKKLKTNIFDDSFLWSDLFDRHAYMAALPWQVKKDEQFNHAIGNFAGMITEHAIKREFVK